MRRISQILAGIRAPTSGTLTGKVKRPSNLQLAIWDRLREAGVPHGYYAGNHKGLAGRDELAARLIVPNRTPTLDDDARAMALTWEDLGHGYWRVLGGRAANRIHLIRTVQTTGFETAINVAATRWVQVQALDWGRRVLGVSAGTRVT